MTSSKRRRRSSLYEELESDTAPTKRVNLGDNLFTITSSTHKTVYSELNTLDDLHSAMRENPMLWDMHSSHSLLPQPISELRRSLEMKKAIQADVEQLDSSFIASDSSLWVDKYAPQRFRELLSNERTNRDVLRWIKKWDELVFPKGVSRGNRMDSRPEKKILLLSGPPGIGKTTLAHVLAEHCGYHPMEINASDDRTKAKFKSKVEAAIEMQAVFGDRKPNLVVIDEIDGISASEGNGVAQVLIDLANSTKRPLRRPILCLCNDPYAPALRQLRRHALHFTLERPKTASLCSRLLEICKKEDLVTDAHALSALCGLADNDIRSCLNTLQMIRRRTRKVTCEVIRDCTIGQKDTTKSVFHVWDQIFHPQQKKKQFQRRLLQGLGGSAKPDEGTPRSPIHHLNDIILSQGNMEKVIEGCHSHYLSMRFMDNDMRKTTTCSDWIAWSASLPPRMKRYVPFGLCQLTLTIPQEIEPDLHFPREQNQLSTRVSEFRNIVSSFFQSLGPEMVTFMPRDLLMTDYISHLLTILTPTCMGRTKNLSDEEKAEVHRVVQLMHAFGLEFVQEKEFQSNGYPSNTMYQMDPPIHRLVSFPVGEDKENQNSSLLHTQRHMLALELEKEKFHSSRQQRKALAMQQVATEKRQKAEALLSEARQRNQAIAQGKGKSSGPKDFFGRTVTPSTPRRTKNASLSPANSPSKYTKYSVHQVFFKFQEGHTNAVRRTVTMKQFL